MYQNSALKGYKDMLNPFLSMIIHLLSVQMAFVKKKCSDNKHYNLCCKMSHFIQKLYSYYVCRR